MACGHAVNELTSVASLHGHHSVGHSGHLGRTEGSNQPGSPPPTRPWDRLGRRRLPRPEPAVWALRDSMAAPSAGALLPCRHKRGVDSRVWAGP